MFFLLHVLSTKGILAPIIRLLWSESVDELVNLELYPVILFVFTQRQIQVNSK